MIVAKAGKKKRLEGKLDREEIKLEHLSAVHCENAKKKNLPI